MDGKLLVGRCRGAIAEIGTQRPDAAKRDTFGARSMPETAATIKNTPNLNTTHQSAERVHPFAKSKDPVTPPLYPPQTAAALV